jgi:hypothetical protein
LLSGYGGQVERAVNKTDAAKPSEGVQKNERISRTAARLWRLPAAPAI